MQTGCKKEIKRETQTEKINFNEERNNLKEDLEGPVTRMELGLYLYNFFADKSFYKDYISFLKDKKYIPFNDSFYPDDTVKRFQFAIVLTRIIFDKGLEYHYENSIIPKDVSKGVYYYNAVLMVLGLNLMDIYGGLFYPQDYLKLKDMLKAFERIKKYEMGNR